MFVEWRNYAAESSKAVRDFNVARDWSDASILSIWWQGHDNNIDEGWYVELSDGVKTDVVSYEGDESLNSTGWNEWLIALEGFDINISSVVSLRIGFNGSDQIAQNGNIIRIDDIRLYQPQCLEVPLGDLNGDCRVDIEDLAILSQNWLVDNMWPSVGQ